MDNLRYFGILFVFWIFLEQTSKGLEKEWETIQCSFLLNVSLFKRQLKLLDGLPVSQTTYLRAFCPIRTESSSRLVRPIAKASYR